MAVADKLHYESRAFGCELCPFGYFGGSLVKGLVSVQPARYPKGLGC